MRLSYILILLGIVLMILGCGVTLVPLSTVGVGSVTIDDISPTSATLIGVGAVILIVGVVLYLKNK